MVTIPLGGERRDAMGRLPLELGPATTYEALTRQMVEQLSRELSEIKGRLNALLFTVVAATVADVVVRMTG